MSKELNENPEILCLYCGITDTEDGFMDHNEEDLVGVCEACGYEIIKVVKEEKENA